MKNYFAFKIILFVGLFLNALNLDAQLWTWMSGGNATHTTSTLGGVYGTQGVTTNTNFPGARAPSAFWQDASGNFWMFGGAGSFPSGGNANDLWKYNPTANLWTWMHGSNLANQTGTYGTQGVSASGNMPGARGASCYWVDLSGNFWLFGGGGYGSSTNGSLNDLWKYNPTTNEWTWVKGSSGVSQLGTYGTLGVSNAANCPGGRTCKAFWTDSSGDLWLFGGFGYASVGAINLLNDLWKYNIASNQWTWMGGSNLTNQPGIYGTLGVGSGTNIPGARNGTSIWKDGSGMIWLYGGSGVPATTTNGFLSDLWKFNPTNNTWAWIGGSNGVNQSVSYGTKGVASATNNPGARISTSAWPELNGNLYMFGGNIVGGSYVNDLWQYNILSGNWTWVSGSNQLAQYGSYGTQGTPNTTNLPGARGGAGTWKDASGGLWMFGGYGVNQSLSYAYLNEVWKYELCSTPSTPTNITSSNELFICSNNSTTLTASSDSPISWYSSLGSSVSIATGSSIITPTLAPGSYTYFAEANLCNPSASREAIVVTVNTTPTVAVNSGSICQGNSFTIVPSGAAIYYITGGSTTVSPANTSTYLISGASSSGCNSSNSVVCTVTVNPTPSVSITGTNAICFGNTTSLTGSGATTYTWNNITAGSVYTASPTSNTTYTVLGENIFTCKNSSTIAITVYSLPILSVSDGTICEGNSFTITPNGATTYSFSNGGTIVSPLVNSAYTITGTSIEGCAASNTAICNVVVNSLPTFTLSGSNNVCLGSSITLLVNGSPVSYTWNTGSNANLIVLSPTVNTISSVTVTGSNGCKDSANKVITVHNLPTVTAGASTTLLCEGKALTLNGYGAVTYSWSGNAINNTIFYPLVSKTYTVTGTDGNGCMDTDVIVITVNPLPMVTAVSSSSSICAGETSTLLVSGATTYTWNTNENTTSIVISPSSTIIFTVTGTDANGCSKEISITQEVVDCTSFDNVLADKNQIVIYPNPSSGLFNVTTNSSNKNSSIEIYNLLAQKIVSISLDDKNTIDLSDYPDGVYTAFIIIDNKLKASIKIIKQ